MLNVAVIAPVAVGAAARVKPNLPRVWLLVSSVIVTDVVVLGEVGGGDCVRRPFLPAPSSAVTRWLISVVSPSSVLPLESVVPFRIVSPSTTGCVVVSLPPNR